MQYKNRVAKIHAKGTLNTYVPWLNLSGAWLEKAGFDVGDNIAIAVRKNAIKITVALKAPKQQEHDEYFEPQWD
ncbi:type I toxin-antitoxin system SymE family toxin [Chitinophaga sp. G-6-1-13]|uniref:Type I toxin-antitoxin system SymE family toxin n=1 Tax=Chitinophaga fulva TaxID=2728842 RepID=A0A848GPK6_9BACT|nr:SymE family type I addiction module toxin [Chitinophaga fulva]NML40426.1 type I toxin-antitoxin system SymE family toxin [Chitinophaga fulva]